MKERYKIIRFITRGGMGSTYLVWDILLEKELVLKVLDLGKIQSWKELELFEREIKYLKNLDHPNIPDYYNSFELDLNGLKYYFLVQEYARGPSLCSLTQDGKKFSLDEAMDFFKSLLEIMIPLHNLEPPLIHRDINPKFLKGPNQNN